ncbi:MAG: hypothetical protein KBS41_04115 [Oscillospiraceae bacterium]|nr:hypothetical protein [Candidatus Equicaccousia limihippi]
MKVAKIILGILLFLTFPYFLFAPVATEIFYSYFLSVVAGIVGIVAIVDFIINRKNRKLAGLEVSVGGLVVAVSIVNIIFMLLNVYVDGFVVAINLLWAYMLLILMIVRGIMDIVGAFTYRQTDGSLKVLTIIWGALLIIGGIAGLGFPAVVLACEGIAIGIGVGMSGISLLISAFSE